MRLASHILAVFLAISTIVSPCLASIKTGDGNTQPSRQEIAIAIADRGDVDFRPRIDKACDGPCAKLLVLRNVQPVRIAVVNELVGFEAGFLLLHNDELTSPPTTLKPTSQVCTSSVDLFRLCRLLN